MVAINSHYVRKVRKLKVLHQENSNIQFHVRSTLDFPVHLHDVLELVFLREGTVKATSGGKSYTLGPGDIFVSFPNQPHGYTDSRGVAGDVLIIPTNPCLSPWRSMMAQKIPAHPVVKKGTFEHTRIQDLLEMLRPERRTISAPVLQGYAMVIVGKILPCLTLVAQPDSGSDTLHRLLGYINVHYREPLTRKDIACAVGYNESYISHVFADNLNTTFKDYITSLRLDEAKTLLTDTDMTVSQISLVLGFGSIRSFNRIFLKQLHMSPLQYRMSKKFQ